jgi:hypothetical protein
MLYVIERRDTSSTKPVSGRPKMFKKTCTPKATEYSREQVIGRAHRILKEAGFRKGMALAMP